MTFDRRASGGVEDMVSSEIWRWQPLHSPVSDWLLLLLQLLCSSRGRTCGLDPTGSARCAPS